MNMRVKPTTEEQVAILGALVKKLLKRVDVLEADLEGLKKRRAGYGYTRKTPDDVAATRIISALVDQAAEDRGMTTAMIYGEARDKPVVHARHWVFYEAYRRGIPYLTIGRIMGFDHTTVINGARNEGIRRGVIDPEAQGGEA